MTIYGRCRHTAGACGHGEAAAAFGDLGDQHELVGAQPALRAIIVRLCIIRVRSSVMCDFDDTVSFVLFGQYITGVCVSVRI